MDLASVNYPGPIRNLYFTPSVYSDASLYFFPINLCKGEPSFDALFFLWASLCLPSFTTGLPGAARAEATSGLPGNGGQGKNWGSGKCGFCLSYANTGLTYKLIQRNWKIIMSLLWTAWGRWKGGHGNPCQRVKFIHHPWNERVCKRFP